MRTQVLNQVKNPQHILNAFTAFMSRNNLLTIIRAFVRLKELCVPLINPTSDPTEVYNYLREGIRSTGKYSAQRLWSLLDERINSTYFKGLPCSRRKMLVVGGGPAGYRMAVEGAMLGFSVTLLEKRTDITRFNILHIWDITVEDLMGLGVKASYPTFGAGSKQHIPIKDLQAFLLRVALVLGVTVVPGADFTALRHPLREGAKYRVVANVDTGDEVKEEEYECDVLVGADGSNSRVAGKAGIVRETSKGAMAIGLTTNFVNTNSEQERLLEEISKADQYDRPFFDRIARESGLRLENLVFYMCISHHYFVVTPNKKSLLDTGVLRQDLNLKSGLFARDNIDQEKLEETAKAMAVAAGLPTSVKLCMNNGNSSTGLFDFSSCTNAKQATVLRHFRLKEGDSPTSLVCCVVGDALQQPFWPQGTGHNRATMSVLDTSWMLRSLYRHLDGGGRRHFDADTNRILLEREALLPVMKQISAHQLANPRRRSGVAQSRALLSSKYGNLVDPKQRYKSAANENLSQTTHTYITIDESPSNYYCCDSSSTPPSN